MTGEDSDHLTPLSESPLALVTYILVVQRRRYIDLKGDRTLSQYKDRLSGKTTADWMPTDKTTELSRIKLKTWTQQPVPMMNEHSAHLTSLPFGFRTWLWQYTCLLLISMLWHRQAIFESKGGKLSSSAECRIRTWKSQGTYSPADWMPTHIYIHTCTNTHTLVRKLVQRKSACFPCRGSRVRVYHAVWCLWKDFERICC